MLGYVTYDSEVGDRYPENPTNGEYAVMSVTMSIGDYLFRNDPLSASGTHFGVGTVDRTYHVRAPDALYEGVAYVDGVPRSFEDLDWAGGLWALDVWTSSNELVLDDSLPTWFPEDIAVFDLRRTFLVDFYPPGYPENGYFLISGELTSIRVVPEPVTVVLLGLGALAAARRRKRA
jgi:hypothetical protein